MKVRTKRQIRLAGGILFVMYILLLIYFLFFAEWYGRGPDTPPQDGYNLTPFLEIKRFWRHRELLGFRIVFLNLAGNIIGFIPFGFILPVLHRHFRHGFLVIFLGCLLSSLVEYMQYVLKVGSCDVDDVILNTTGTLLGYLFFIICNTIRRHHYGKRTKV